MGLDHATMQDDDSAQSFWKTALNERLSPLQESNAGNPSRRDVQDALDAEDAVLRDVLLSIRSRQNAFSPIGTLPPEVLAMVFKIYADEFPPESYLTPSEGSALDPWKGLAWVLVTYVCRRWREVALEHPSLWRRINLEHGPRWTREFISRAKAIPLVFQGQALFLASPNPVITELLHANLQRIQSISVEGNHHALKAITNALAILAAPILHVLDIKQFYYRPTPDERVTLAHISAPRLTHLKLDGVQFMWSAFPMGNLTHLYITVEHRPAWARRHGGEPIFIPGHDKFISLLAQMTRLENLHLSNCIPSCPTSSINDGRFIKLPHLAALKLNGATVDIVDLMRRITMPLTATIHLVCSSDDSSGEECLSVLPFITGRLSATTGESIRFRVLTITEGEQFESLGFRVRDCCVWKDNGNAQLFASRAAGEVNLQLDWGNPDFRDVVPIARRICKALPLQDVEALGVLGQQQTWHAGDWVDAFRSCRAVRYLQILNAETSSLSDALMQTIREDDSAGLELGAKCDRTMDRMLFPKLQTVYVEGHTFEHGEPIRDPPEVFDAAFLQCLQDRKERNAGIQKLYLVNCDMKVEFYQAYQDAVVDLLGWWDEDFMSESDEEIEEEHE
ncbi:hypothetical protein BV25DRAFT_1995565 [Artomyces pyxidatus]|uniref:Uncharacterized protein n=1 Tax=Artomyces pyxidatus TaxID=48021 RepID=A0ACB8SKM5_9AGAM|nr:hypothetical protein BV25DRAFT_1995565 [Artomyces pyxidatus]